MEELSLRNTGGCPLFSSDIYETISIEACVSRRNTPAARPESSEDCILSGEAWIEIKKTRVMG